MVKFEPSRLLTLHCCGHILMFDLWLQTKMRNGLFRKYLILRRAHISVCPSWANQRPGQAWRPIRASEETSRDPHWDQQDLGCFKSPLLRDRVFYPCHIVCLCTGQQGRRFRQSCLKKYQDSKLNYKIPTNHDVSDQHLDLMIWWSKIN